MSRKSTYEMGFRRRREEKTNYVKRLGMLKCGQMRLVVRKSNNNTTVQMVKYEKRGDEIIASAISKELAGFGWGAHTGNVPSAYLTGLLCGFRARKKGTESAILDIGLNTPVHGSRIFAALKGAVDAGLKVKCDESVFPSAERVCGKHINEKVSEQFEKVKAEIAGRQGGK